MENKKIKLALIASGSGTLANAIMQACRKGCIKSAEPVVLVSTKTGAECVEKAQANKIPFILIDHKEAGSAESFDEKIRNVLAENGIELVFLVGCIVKIPAVPGIKMYNVHPADLEEHGGKGMYGLAVHAHVLEKIKEEIESGKKKAADEFLTHPTVHEAASEYDNGRIFLKGSVQIPQKIIADFMNGKKTAQESAQELQKVVLQYEWIMWPAAVEAAAKELLRGIV